ncbi:thiol:disulfide interchange protein DsbA/DsbL [soil metagenome]
MKHLIATFLFALAAVATAQPAGAQALAVDVATLAPRPGIDFEVLAQPVARFAPVKAKLEVVEVFSYACIHCAHFQPAVDKWLSAKPKDVQWEYVPAVFGGPFTSFAAAYYAAEAAGIQKRSHSAVFKAIFDEKVIKTAEPAEIADLYARWGADRTRFIASMDSPAVRDKMAKAKGFAIVTGVNGTPTLIVNGKYRMTTTTDRSSAGLLHTLDLVLARERKGLPPPAAGQAL